MPYQSQSNIQEGNITRSIEEQASRIPDLGYVGFAVGSMVLSATLAFLFRRREMANFVGLWAPSILILGVFNRLRRLEHHETPETRHRFGQAA